MAFWSFIIVLVIGPMLVVGQDVLVVSPQNQACLAGELVTLRCATQPGRPLYWNKCSTRNSCTRISNDNTIIFNPEGRYSIDNPVAGQYNLVISSTKADDASQYKCETSRTFFGEYGYSEVIILGGPPSCSTTPSLVDIPADSEIHISCHQPFTGRWAPSIQCQLQTHATSIQLADNSSNTTAIFEGVIDLPLTLNQDAIICQTYFDHPHAWEGIPGDEAQNEANVTSTWLSGVIVMIYKPVELSITPEKSIFTVGESITCSASANPHPTYVWRDAETNDVITSGDILMFTSQMVGIVWLSCDVENSIGLTSEQRQIQVYQDSQHECTECGSCPLAVVGSVLGCLLVVSVILNVLLVLHVRNVIQLPHIASKASSKTHKPPQPQLGLSTISTRTMPRSNSLDQSNSYHYISDDDVMFNNTTTTTTTFGESTHSQYRPYEPFSFENGGMSMDDRSLPKAPTTIGGSSSTLSAAHYDVPRLSYRQSGITSPNSGSTLVRGNANTGSGELGNIYPYENTARDSQNI